jgi:hypothetical protein
MAMDNDRIHAAIDGEIRRENLTEAERARLAEMEATLDTAAASLRAARVPDLTDRVLAGLPAPPPAPAAPRPGARLAAWLWRPVTVRFRPAFALAGLAVAALAGVVVVPRLAPAPQAAAAVAESGAGAPLYVQFRLRAPGASRVAVAGSFTDWQPEYELSEVSPGLWSVMVPLRPGVYDYTFVIDGQRMVVDPYAPRVADSYGGSNSRLFLPAPSGRA